MPKFIYDKDTAPILMCPVCGFEYSHVRGVDVRSSNPCRDEIDVTLHITGECEHDWSLVFSQHKGSTEVSFQLKEIRGKGLE